MMFQLKNKKDKRGRREKNPPEHIADKMFTLSLTNFIVMML